MALGWILLNAAYLVYTASALFKRMLHLRAVLLAATFLYMIYGLVEPNWSVFFWNIPVAALHSYAVWRLLRDRRSINLSDEAVAIQKLIFPDLERLAFNVLWQCGEERTVTDEVLIRVDEDVPELSLILAGELEVLVNNGNRVLVGPFRLIGEVSTLKASKATATVTAIGEVRLRAWNKQKLAAATKLYPEIQVAMLTAMGQEVARKLT